MKRNRRYLRAKKQGKTWWMDIEDERWNRLMSLLLKLTGYENGWAYFDWVDKQRKHSGALLKRIARKW